MVLVDVEVAFHADVEVDAAMTANLLQHVVEESKACLNVAGARTVECKADSNVGLLRGASHAGTSLTVDDGLGSLLPAHFFGQDNCLTTYILSQLAIGVAVADDVAIGNVVLLGVVHVFLHHTCARLASRGVVFRKMRVDEDIVEMDALTLQGLQDKVLGGPECFLGKGGRAQTVLIAHHHELIVGALGYEPQPAEYAGLEADFFQSVHLLVVRLFHQCAVAVDE